MGKMYIPFRFIHGLEDERLIRLLKRVWKRLPACDRRVLRKLVTDVNDYTFEKHELGSAHIVDSGWSMSGNAGDAVMELENSVNLGGAKKIRSDAACMFVIAHEFAHVVLA
jgi:hypothetical protein